jgi:anti-anti-sigma factor
VFVLNCFWTGFTNDRGKQCCKIDAIGRITGGLLINKVMSKFNIFQPSRILSAGNASDLTDWTRFALDSGAKVLLIDFCHVMFMDSSGLGTLVSVLKMVQKAGGRMAVCSLSGQARMLFEVSGMEKLFEIYTSLDEFKAALS